MLVQTHTIKVLARELGGLAELVRRIESSLPADRGRPGADLQLIDLVLQSLDCLANFTRQIGHGQTLTDAAEYVWLQDMRERILGEDPLVAPVSGLVEWF